MQQAMISAAARREQLKMHIASRSLVSPERRLSSPPFHAAEDEQFFPPDSIFSTPLEFDLGSTSGVVPSPALPGFRSSGSFNSSAITFQEPEEASALSGSRLYLARLTLQYQEITDRYHLCVSHLQEAADEADALRRENAALRLANVDLTKRLSILAANLGVVTAPGRVPISSGATSLTSTLSNELRRLRVAEPLPDEKSPTSVLSYGAAGDNRLAYQQPAAAAERRVTLPKSISIRSSGYLKLNPSGGSGSATNRAGRIRVSSPVMTGPQRLLVGGGVGRGKKEEEEEEEEKAEGEVVDGDAPLLELEAYSQGMFKTELCNKWEENGECPYGENCQFAHGIPEMRPVIRHPRYKTEVCRMVLAGDACPYGHRCHFRHTLTPSDLPLGP